MATRKRVRRLAAATERVVSEEAALSRYDRRRLQAIQAVAERWGRAVCCFAWGRNDWCGGRTVALLDLDHIDGRGTKGGASRVEEARKHPERFQLLCANHHRWKTRRLRETDGHRRRRAHPAPTI